LNWKKAIRLSLPLYSNIRSFIKQECVESVENNFGFHRYSFVPYKHILWQWRSFPASLQCGPFVGLSDIVVCQQDKRNTTKKTKRFYFRSNNTQSLLQVIFFSSYLVLISFCFIQHSSPMH